MVRGCQEGKEDTASDRDISPPEEPVFLSLMAGLTNSELGPQGRGGGFPGSSSLSPFHSLSHRETRGALFCVLGWSRALSPMDGPMQIPHRLHLDLSLLALDPQGPERELTGNLGQSEGKPEQDTGRFSVPLTLDLPLVFLLKPRHIPNPQEGPSRSQNSQ